MLQDIRSYEEMQESLALLKILALSQKSKNEGHVKPLEKSFRDIRTTIAGQKNNEL